MHVSLNFLLLYAGIALALFGFYVSALLRDRSTSKTNSLSWLTLGVASAFWPLVLPVSLYHVFLRRRTLKALGIKGAGQTQASAQAKVNNREEDAPNPSHKAIHR